MFYDTVEMRDGYKYKYILYMHTFMCLNICMGVYNF